MLINQVSINNENTDIPMHMQILLSGEMHNIIYIQVFDTWSCFGEERNFKVKNKYKKEE